MPSRSISTLFGVARRTEIDRCDIVAAVDTITCDHMLSERSNGHTSADIRLVISSSMSIIMRKLAVFAHNCSNVSLLQCLFGA